MLGEVRPAGRVMAGLAKDTEKNVHIISYEKLWFSRARLGVNVFLFDCRKF